MTPIDEHIRNSGIELPALTLPMAALLRPDRIHDGPVLRISAQLPKLNGKIVYIGKLGREFDLEAGQAAARLAALNVISQCRAALDGDLGRVKMVLSLRGYVNADPEFAQIAEVVNGASELMVQIFGTEKGMHTRTAIGAAVMPFQAAVEIEATFAI